MSLVVGKSESYKLSKVLHRYSPFLSQVRDWGYHQFVAENWLKHCTCILLAGKKEKIIFLSRKLHWRHRCLALRCQTQTKSLNIEYCFIWVVDGSHKQPIATCIQKFNLTHCLNHKSKRYFMYWPFLHQLILQVWNQHEVSSSAHCCMLGSYLSHLQLWSLWLKVSVRAR